MKNYFLSTIFFYLIACNYSFGQLSEGFNGDLSLWSGNIEDFIINSDNKLQLMAEEGGISALWAPMIFPNDWQALININLNFAPSNNNKCRIYFLKNNPSQELGDGYFIQIGENGSDDAISIYLIKEGIESLIASGTMGAVAEEPVTVGLSLSRMQENGMWQLKADYNGGQLFVPDIDFIDNEVNVTGEGFFVIECIYSTTRKDKFFFDDIIIREFSEDIIPPVLLEANVIDGHQISLVYDEILEEMTTEKVENFMIQETEDIPSSVDVNNNKILLTFSNSFISGPPFSLLIKNIEDLNGNNAENIVVRDLVYAVPPKLGDLYINEILFDPYPGDEDFIEIFNSSSKVIAMQGLEIHNLERGDVETISSQIRLQPESFIAFSTDIDALESRYLPPQTSILHTQKLPGFNNGSGNVLLMYKDEILDSFDYHEDLHSPIIADSEGVSLERISIDIPSNVQSNWTSGQSTNHFATPGYKNGSTISSIISDDILSMRSTNFSPNADGNNDYMILDYNLDKAGYIAEINVFNDLGYKIKNIANNVSLAAKGFIQWDGITDDGIIGRIGVYIVMVKLFHPDGETYQKKLAVVLVKDL